MMISINRLLPISLSAFMILSIMLSTIPKAPAQALPVAGLTVGLFLNRMVDQLQQTIDQARSAGQSVTIEAAREANIVIQNAKNAYVDSMNLTMDRVDQTLRTTLDKIQALVDEVVKETKIILDDFSKRAQQLTNSLPFHKQQPQLTSYTPNFVVPSREPFPVTIKFRGNFEFASQEKYKPTLEFDGEIYNLVANTTQELTFQVPVTRLTKTTLREIMPRIKETGDLQKIDEINEFLKLLKKPLVNCSEGMDNISGPIIQTLPGPLTTIGDPEIAPPLTEEQLKECYPFTYATGTLIVPWEKKGNLVGLGKEQKTDTYKILIGKLPSSLGRIQLIHTTKYSKTIQKRFESQEYYQSSASDAGNDDKKDKPYSVSPEDGWRIVRGTAAFNVKGNKGEWSHSFSGDDGNKVSYNVTTIHVGTTKPWEHKDSGQVRFTISFVQQKDESYDLSNVENVSLKWGESKIFNYNIGDWKIVYDDFTGLRTEYAGTGISNPFLKLRNEGGQLSIGTQEPKSINFP